MNRGGWEGLNMSTRWLGMLLGLPHLEVAGWGGIYSHQPNCSRWRSLLAMGVSGAPPRHPPVRAWSWSTVGGFVLMWHRTVRCYTGQSGAPLTICSDIWIALFTLQSRPLRAGSCCPAGAPDSPVAHRTVRWIIAELAWKTRSWGVWADSPLCTIHCPVVHQTLSGGTPDCPVRQTRAHFGFLFAPFFWSLTCSFDWFVLNLWHL
jgi:hypothetical protein